jgi:hypothetical protein
MRHRLQHAQVANFKPGLKHRILFRMKDFHELTEN